MSTGTGSTHAETIERVSINPPPAGGKELRWHDGRWEKLMAKGWVPAGEGKTNASKKSSGGAPTRHHATKKSKSPAQLDREIAEYTKEHPIKRSESEKAIHPEMFAVMNRKGKILGRAYSVKGAMALAPDDKSYAIVRGEFTSEGTNWGVGRGRQVAVREFDPSRGFRWYVSDYGRAL